MSLESIDKLRDYCAAWRDGMGGYPADVERIANEIEREIEDRIDDLMTTSVDGYPEPFNTPDAMHMVLGTAADCFDTPQEAVHYLRGETSMELPVDADGVPIHVGDKMQYHGGEPFTVCAVAPGVIHVWAAVKLGERKTTYDYAPIQCMHYKPRTIEDVLQCAGVSVAAIEDVAAEIRELMGDAE